MTVLRAHSWLAPLLLAAGAVGQTITFLEGTPASADVLSVSESQPNGTVTTVLQNVELLAIEITGRVLGQEHDATRSRRLERHGLTRIELPGAGRLFRYRRNGGAFWGFLHIAPNGTPRSVLEQPGFANADPFEDRIGIARDGSHFAVPMLAGGLHIVRLDGNNYASTGTPARFVSGGSIVEPTSVLVGDQVVWFQSENLEVLRCSLTDGAQPLVVSPPSNPNARLKDEMAMSGDGSRIVYLYGPTNQQLRLYTVTVGAATATLLPPGPSKYEEPGYLPEEPGSAELLLNDDGSRLLYVDSLVRDELYLADLAGTLPTLQITDDPVFEPYIGVHILPGFYGGDLTVAIGDLGLMDWYRASLSAGGGTVVNMTGTGSFAQPFPEGTLDPRTALADGSVMLAVEQAASSLVVRTLDLAAGSSTLLASNATRVPQRGSSFGAATDVVLSRPFTEELFAAGNLSAPLFIVPSVVRAAAPVANPLFSTVLLELPGTGWSVPAYYLTNGQSVLGSLTQGLQQVCATVAGGVVLVGTDMEYVSLAGSVAIPRPPQPWRRCLSGAGA